MFEALKDWTPVRRKVVTASVLGWTLDAFDYFLLVFVIKDVARDFGTTREVVAWALTLTLASRPIGAFLFGRLADRFGRRPMLMLDVALYSLMGLASAFAPNLATFLIVRALFGIAMGGEWGIGASLTMETVNPKSRGLVSGLLQSGYPTGYLLASIVFALPVITTGKQTVVSVQIPLERIAAKFPPPEATKALSFMPLITLPLSQLSHLIVAPMLCRTISVSFAW